VEFGEEFEGDEEFADADGVDPEPRAVAPAFAEPGVVAAEALSEIPAEAAAAEHACEVAREDGEDGEGEKERVEQADHASGVRR
jgi:hypothetical protein